MADVVWIDLRCSTLRGSDEEGKKLLDGLFAPFTKYSAYV